MPAKVEITEPAKNIVEVSTSPITVEITEQTHTVSVNATVSSGSANTALLNSLDVTNTIGDAVAGDTYAAGTTLETIVRDLIAPFLEPTFTAISWSATGTHQAAGENLLVECGKAATAASASITWSNPENLDDNTNLTATDLDTNLSIQDTDIADYGALASPYIYTLNYAIPISTGPNTRNIKFATAYLGDNGTGDKVTLEKTVSIFHRHRFYVRAGATQLSSQSIDTWITGTQSILNTLALDPTLSSQEISVSCTSDTVDTTKYTWIVLPSAGTLTAVYAEVGGGSVIDYTDSFTLFDNSGNYYTRTAGTATPTYKIYRSNQTGAFDSDVTLKLTITH